MMKRIGFCSFAASAVYATSAFGQTANPAITTVKVVVPAIEAVSGGSQLAGFVYLPATETQTEPLIYTFFNGGIRKIGNLDAPSAPAGTQMLNKTPWTTWQQDIQTNGLTGLGGGQPIVQGAALNPVQIGDAAPFTMALLTDIPTNVRKNSGAPLYGSMKRLYTYNLQQATPSLTDDLSGYSVLTPKMTAAEHYAAGGVTPNPLAPNGNGVILSQPVFSYDGSHAYFIDGTTNADAVGGRGIYRTDLINGGTQRIYQDGGRARSEFAVAKLDATTDRLYLTGTAKTGNQDGLSAVNVDTTAGTVDAFEPLVSQSTFRSFFNGDASTVYGVDGIVVDGPAIYLAVSGGNIQAGVNGTSRSAILKYADGKLSKVISYAERRTGFGASMASPSKLQIRNATYTAPNGATSTRKQLMYTDTNNYVGGVFIFDAGDFNHDGNVDQTDAALFAAPGVLGLRGSTTSDASKFVFDLNANVLANTSSTITTVQTVGIDYTDVKNFQEAYAFPDGDSNFDRTVNFDDLVPLAQNYNTTGKVWTQGDFDGDAAGTVNFDDLVILAQNYNATTLPGGTVVNAYGADFAADWSLARALVPEPTSLAMLSVAGVVLSRRRR